MNNFDPKTQIAIIWGVDDVLALDKNLTKDEAFEVLKSFEHHHDGSMEQMWFDLQYHLDMFREQVNV